MEKTLRQVVRAGLVWGGIALAAACGGGSEPVLEPATVSIVTSTDGQSAPAGARLPLPLAVVAQATSGDSVPRAEVRWRVTSGAGATLSDSVTLADGHGRAEVVLTLGPTAGEYRVQATLVARSDQSVVFTATATQPPVLTQVAPGTFSGGDTLQLTGTGLSAAAEVEIAGAPARVLAGSATRLSVVAPVCLAPGPVSIRARVAGAPSNALPGTYASAAAVALAPGEYASIDPAQLAGCATFPDAGPQGAEYLVAPQAATGSPGVSAAYRLEGNAVIVTVSAAARPTTELPLAMRFHDMLRAQEREASLRARAPQPAALLAPAATTAVKVGDQRTFQVCNKIPCSATSDFTAVTAHAKYVGVHAALFTDDAAPAPGFSSADYDSLGVMFDQDLYGVDTRAFGSESDIDANGVVIVLFTPEVNRLTPENQCSTSVITGYFFGIDIDPQFQSDPRSNKGEVFYALAPDPSGTVTCTLSTEIVRRLVPVTFVHEFQHMISYHQHTLVRGSSSEVLWLNEALSHTAEELAGLHFEAQGRNDLFSRFAIGDLYNGYIYLQNPGGVFVLPDEGTGTLEERGGAWLFMRWLLDQYGGDLTRLLVETERTGADNVAAAAGIPIGQLLAQWFLANWVSDLGGFTAPARLKYTTWRLRTTYQSLHDQLPSRFPVPYPLVPDVFAGGTFAFDGTLHAGSGDYFRVVQGANDRGFTVTMTGPGGGVLPAAAVPRLNVIRIR